MYGLHINNCEATRITPSTMTCIDHSISNTFYDIATLRCNISDHYALVNFLNASDRPQNKRNFPRNWKRNFNFSRNYISILKYLFLIHQFLSKIEANWSVDKKLAHITRSINQALDRFAPYQSFKNSKKSWITNECQKQRQQKNKCYKKLIKNPTPENHKNYKKERNICNKTIRNAKIAFYDKSTANFSNSKELFSTIRSLWGKAKNVSGNLINATKFNEYFNSIGEKLAAKFTDNKKVKSNIISNTFVFAPITIKETTNAIKKLKNGNSIGHDGISNKTIKQTLPVISQPLTELFNQCFDEGYYPSDLKVARVIPIYKDGSVMTRATTDQSVYLHQLIKFLKRSFSTE